MEIIIGKNAGFCYGVQRAVDKAIEETKKGTVYCLGEIVHNQNVIDNLKNAGVCFINKLEESKGNTIIRAHGVPKEVYDEAENKNINLIDLTCPSVLKIQNLAEEYSEKGYFIIIVGKDNHPEVIGIKSRAGKNYKIIDNKSEISEILNEINSKKKVLLISQTTHSSYKFDEIAQELKAKISKAVQLEIKKTICPSTETRQKETEKIAKKVDMMIIIGDKRSSNTNKLYDIACKFCNDVVFISNETELNIDKIKKIKSVGIMAGASTPKEDIIKIKELLLNHKDEM